MMMVYWAENNKKNQQDWRQEKKTFRVFTRRMCRISTNEKFRKNQKKSEKTSKNTQFLFDSL
jgi:hypothetical protein